MAEPSPDKIVIGAIGPLITTVIGAAIGWLPGGLTGAVGSALTTLLAAVGAISGLAFSLIYKRYIGVLGAGGGRKGYPARDAYERLRASLSGGNLASRLYADWLAKFLDAVDRFFGDAGKADQTLFPRAFGLKTPAPLWTVLAFDRSLLLALIYPVVTIFIIWAISGHVGPAEAAFRLEFGVAGWQRALAVGLTVASIHLWRRALPTIALPTIRFGSRTWWGAGDFALGLVLVVLAGAFSGTPPLNLSLIITLADALTGATVATIAVAVGLGSCIHYVGATLATSISAIAVCAISAVAIVRLEMIAIQKRRQGVFLSLHLFTMIIICFAGATWVSPLGGWRIGGPLLLFLGLITLINAPFDWASLGLTRALLRRGLELGGWWPYLLALIDALAAAVVIAFLAITMVIGVQTFDHLAGHSGGADARVLPLDKLFDGIAAEPSAPEYWWAYALLLSTMTPSLLNLMIGGASLLRGIPGLPALLLRFMPAGKAVPAFDRTWLALVLTCQVFVGAFLGIAAQFVLAIGVIFYVLPWIGLELLETARAVAEFDLPGRVLGVWWANH